MRISGIIRKVYSLLLTALFLLPSSIQLTHIADNHEHVVCFDNSEHVHSIMYDCSIQDFQITPFDFDPLSDSNNGFRISMNSKESHYYYQLDKTTNNTSKSLRAPPLPLLIS
jgi:hypothetical protein